MNNKKLANKIITNTLYLNNSTLKSFYNLNVSEGKNIEKSSNNSDNSITSSTKEDSSEDSHHEYFIALNLTKELKSVFCNTKFATLVKFLNDHNYYSNYNLLIDFESILIKNLDNLEIKNKVKAISVLSKKVITESIDYEDTNWNKFFNDFINQRKFDLDEYYNYLVVFDSINNYVSNKSSKTSKDKVNNYDSISKLIINNNLNKEYIYDYNSMSNTSTNKSNNNYDPFSIDNSDNYLFSFKYQNFLFEKNTKFFNKVVKITTIDDIILFSKLIHSKLIQTHLLSDNIWIDLDTVILNHKYNLPMNINYIMPCLFIIHQEYFNIVKSCIIFKNSIKVINNNLFFILNNYELLEGSDKQLLESFSDHILYYAYLFFNNNDNLDSLFHLIKTAYLNKIKTGDNLNWLNELRLLIVIAMKLNYNGQESKEFWNDVFFHLKIFLLTDFDSVLKQMQNSHIKAITNSIYSNYNRFNNDNFDDDILSKNNSKGLMNNNNINNINSKTNTINNSINGLIYYGIVIELASKVYEVLNLTYWNFIINSLSNFINFNYKDIHFNLHYIFCHLHSVYSNPKLNSIWTKFVEIFNPKLKQILVNKDALIFINNSVFKNKNISTNDLSNIMKSLFLVSTPYNTTTETHNSNNNNKYKEEIRSINKDKDNNALCDIDSLLTNEDKLSNKATTNYIDNIKYLSNKKQIKNNKLAKVELFCVIYEILDSSISNNIQNYDNNVKIMANTFVDLLMLESKQILGLNIKSLVEKMNINSFEKFRENVFNRIKDYIGNNPKDNNLIKLIILLHNAGIIEQLELTQLKHYQEKIKEL